MPAGSAQASTQEYRVVAVGIDHNSETAAANALDYARKRALYLAIRKLGVPNPSDAAAKIPEADLAQIIRGATVMQTRREGERTYCEVTVSIVDETLRAALKLKDTVVANPGPIRSILVLPVLATPKGMAVWKNDNLLRAPLGIELLHQSRGSIILAGGDLQDLRLIDGENVAKVTAEELKPMFERYGAQEIIIAILTLGEAGKPGQVILRRLSAQHPHDERLDLPPGKPDNPEPLRLTQAAQAITTAVMQIASSTSEDEQAKLAAATRVPVTFAYTIPRDYAQMAQAVRAAPGVLMLALPGIGINNVTGTIYLNGDKTALRKALIAKGIIIRDKDGQWILSVR